MDETRLSIYEGLARGPKDVPFGYFRDLLASHRALSAALAQETERSDRLQREKDEAVCMWERRWNDVRDLRERLAQAEAEREALRDLIAAELREFPETSSRRLREALPTPAPPSPPAGEEVPS